ncbi:MAG TPA: hypothetical protein VGL02_01320 [Streptomyces sp.]
MAAFDPRTFELLREDLGGETVTYSLDSAHLAKLPQGSQSLMAQQLRARARAETFEPVSRDLKRLLDFMEGVNRLYDEHAAGLHAGWPRRSCDDCPDQTPAGA